MTAPAPHLAYDLEMDTPDANEPERRGPSPKKPLEQFLAEFEARLRDHPGEAATSATAALEGRAEGAWRTPVEGAERTSRRLPRPVSSHLPASYPAPSAADDPGPGSVVDGVLPAGAEVPAPTNSTEPPAAPVPPNKRHHRHRRHHRRR